MRKLLPKIAREITNGGLYTQQVRCGKSKCKCANGERHAATYLFTRNEGKLMKYYVRKRDIDVIKRIVNAAMTERFHVRLSRRASVEMLRRCRQSLMELDANDQKYYES